MLRASGLSKNYGENVVLSDVSLFVGEGSILNEKSLSSEGHLPSPVGHLSGSVFRM